MQGFNAWRESRLKLVERKKDPRAAGLREWEGHYMRGTTVLGVQAAEHQVKRDLQPFAEMDPFVYRAPAAEPAEPPRQSFLQRLFSRK
jgi:hypothetical protein